MDLSPSSPPADIRSIMAKAANQRPPLPWSPCLKSKKSGAIFPWMPSMAERYDLMVNCDEEGNEDPALWQHRVPEKVGRRREILDEKVAAFAPTPLANANPAIETLAVTHGIDPSAIPDTADRGFQQAPMTIPREGKSRPVLDVLDDMFARMRV